MILASQHEGLVIGFVIATAALAAIVGDNIGYVLGWNAGRHLLTRDGRWVECPTADEDAHGGQRQLDDDSRQERDRDVEPAR